MMIDQRTIGDLLSNQLMKLPIKNNQIARRKCTLCGG